MPAVFHKKSSHIDKVLEDSKSATAHGGQLIVDALAKHFELWKKLVECLNEPINETALFSLLNPGVSLANQSALVKG